MSSLAQIVRCCDIEIAESEKKIRAKGQRSPEEDKARGRCREIARDEGSYIRRTEDRRYVFLSECERWPQGAYIPFHGWISVLCSLETMVGQKREEA
jgi:hypothetical protein